MQKKWYERTRILDVVIDDRHEKMPDVRRDHKQEALLFFAGAEVPLETFRLGFGCNTFSGEIRSPALTADDPVVDPGILQGQETEFSFDLIKSKHELNEKMEVSASASYSGLFNVSAKSKFVKEQKLNRDSVYLLIKVLVTNSRHQLKEYNPAEKFAGFLSATPINWDTFIKKYGDQFIDQVVTGGEFYALCEFHTESVEDRNALEVQLKGGGWGAKASGELKKTFDKIDTKMNVTCRLYIRGGCKRLPDIKEDTIIDAALNFPVDVNPEAGAPVVYKAVTKDYFVVDDFPGFPQEVQDSLDRSREFCKKIKHRLALSEDLITNLSSQGDIDPLTVEKLEDIRERLTVLLADIALNPLKIHDPAPLFDSMDAINVENLWRKVPGPELAWLAVGSYQHVWGINPEDKILQWNNMDKSWKTIPGLLCDISVGADGRVWGVNRQDQIFHWDITKWGDVGGRLRQISVGSTKHVWGKNKDGRIFQWAGGKWIDRTTTPLINPDHISAGSDGTVVLLKNRRPFRWKPDKESFELFPGELAQVAVGSSRQIWGVDTAGRVVRWDGESWRSLPGLRRFKYVSAGEDGTLWAVDGVGLIYRLDNAIATYAGLIP